MMPSVNDDDSDFLVKEVSSQLEVVMVSTESSSENYNSENNTPQRRSNRNSEKKNSTDRKDFEHTFEGNFDISSEIETNDENSIQINSKKNSDHNSELDSAHNSQQDSSHKSKPNTEDDYEVIVILTDDDEEEMSRKSTKRTDRSDNSGDDPESSCKSVHKTARDSPIQNTPKSSRKSTRKSLLDSALLSSDESSREPSIEPSRQASSSLDLVENTTSNEEPTKQVNDSSDSSDFFASDTPIISERLKRKSLQKKTSVIQTRQPKRKLSLSSDSSDIIEILSPPKTAAPKKGPTNSQESDGARPRSRRTKPEMQGQTSIASYFSKTRNIRPQRSTASRMSEEMADLLADDPLEADYFSRLDQLDSLKEKEVAASNKKAQLMSKENSLKTHIRKELTTRLSILGPESLLESSHQNLTQATPYSMKTFGNSFNLEQEIEEAITQRSEESEADVDFFFLTPYFKPQSYAFSSKEVFKGWYTFLKYADTPNDMIESGLLLNRIKAHPDDCISFSIWLWILCNIPQSSMPDSTRDQYLQVLTHGLPKLSRESLLQTIYVLFAAVGADTDVISSVCTLGSNSESISMDEDFLASCHLPVLSTKNYFFPQGHPVNLVLEVATTIIVKNESFEIIIPVLILVLLVSIDTSLLYTNTPLEITKNVEALLNAVPNEMWENHEPNNSFWYPAACLLSRIIPAERSELRYRILESLKNGSNQRVHYLRRRLAAVFFQQATSSDVASITFTPGNDVNRLVENTLIPALADPKFFLAKPPTLITAKLQFLLHALHNLPDISVDLSSTLLSHLEPELATLKRSLRTLPQESLVQVSVLDTIVTSIRNSIPSYDVYAE